MRDPKPAPAASLKLAGSPRDDAGAARPPAMPTWLAREAKAEWRRVMPRLLERGILSQIDRATLAAYCETWAEYQRAVKMVRKKGETVMTAKGLVKHPAVAIRNEARAALAQYAVQLGLTPAARVQLAPMPDAGDSAQEKHAA